MLGGNLGKIAKLGRLFVSGLACDPYYGSVALLLHFDGANASTTYTDNSPVPKTVTASGGAQLRTAVFKYGTASGFYNGTSSYITTALNTQLSSSDFTIEGWFYPNAVGSGIQCLFSTLNSNVTNGLEIGFNNTTLYYQVKNGPVSAAVSGGVTATITTGTWYHFALVKNGTSYVIYLNGVGSTPSTFAGTWTDTANATIGAIVASTTFYYLNGYTDDYRITPGIARYTSNFTPPGGAFPDISCGGNIFNASYIYNYPLVPVPSLYNFSTLTIPNYPVGVIPSSWNFSTLTIPDYPVAATPSSWNFSTLNIPNYPVAATPSSWNFSTLNLPTVPLAVPTTAAPTINNLYATSSTINYTLSDSMAFYTALNSTINYTLSDSMAFYTASNSTINYTLSDSTAFYTNAESTIGYTLSASDPEPATDPNFSSVSLLLHLDNTSGSTTTTDVSSSPKTITFNGTSQTINNNTRDTTNNLYVATNGYITAAQGAGLISATGDFTIELWFNSSLAAQGTLFYLDGNSTPTSTSFNRLSVYISTSSTIVFYTESSARITSAASVFSANTWNHVALTRATNVYRLFVNGRLINSFTRTSSQSSTTNNLQIGGYSGATSTEFLTGWIDEVRVTNGVARYTAEFEPRLQPFPNSA